MVDSYQLMTIGVYFIMTPLITVGFFILNDVKLGLLMGIIGYCCILPTIILKKRQELKLEVSKQ